MAASVQFRPHERDLGMVMREVDENLAIFLGINNIESKGFDEPKSERIEPVHNDYFLDSEIDANGYDWLIAKTENGSAKNQTELSRREHARISEQLPSNIGEKLVSVAKDSAVGAKRRPLSGDQKPTPRAPTPPGQRPVAKPKTSRASTPTPARAAFPSSKPRSSTPGRKSTDAQSKPVALDSKKVGLAASCWTFQTVKPRPSKTSETLITKTSFSRRPASASRGRPSSTQKSCSPAKTRVLNGNVGAKDFNVVMPKVRGCSNGDGDDVNPVAMGTKMVERVVNMRKLAPPTKQDDGPINEKRPSSLSNSGFGRSLSKKSLDMAIRHMGIKGSIHDGLSSSARGGHLKICKSSTVGVPESAMTSSSDSAKSCDGSSSYFLDGRCVDY